MRYSNRATVPEVAPLVRAYLAKWGNGAGGSLHIVLSDGNIRDGDVLSCLECAARAGDEDGVRLAVLLAHMTKTQRAKVRHA